MVQLPPTTLFVLVLTTTAPLAVSRSVIFASQQTPTERKKKVAAKTQRQRCLRRRKNRARAVVACAHGGTKIKDCLKENGADRRGDGDACAASVNDDHLQDLVEILLDAKLKRKQTRRLVSLLYNYAAANEDGANDSDGTACPKSARNCPDGTIVVPDQDDCEFPPCCCDKSAEEAGDESYVCCPSGHWGEKAGTNKYICDGEMTQGPLGEVCSGSAESVACPEIAIKCPGPGGKYLGYNPNANDDCTWWPCDSPCCDPVDLDLNECSEGFACCPDGTWSCKRGGSGGFKCGGKDLHAGSWVGPYHKACEAATGAQHSDCSTLSACSDCLVASPGCYWVGGQCLKGTCASVADVACYELENESDAVGEVCAIADAIQNSRGKCNPIKNCAECVSTELGEGVTTCVWVEHMQMCSADPMGIWGSGTTSCTGI